MVNIYFNDDESADVQVDSIKLMRFHYEFYIIFFFHTISRCYFQGFIPVARNQSSRLFLIYLPFSQVYPNSLFKLQVWMAHVGSHNTDGSFSLIG